MGYPPDKKGWRVLDLETQQMFNSRDVRFEESVFPFSQMGPNSPVDTTDTLDADFTSWATIHYALSQTRGDGTTSDSGPTSLVLQQPNDQQDISIARPSSQAQYSVPVDVSQAGPSAPGPVLELSPPGSPDSPVAVPFSPA